MHPASPGPRTSSPFAAEEKSLLRTYSVPAKHTGAASSFYDDGVDYSVPHPKLPAARASPWPRSGYTLPDGWTEQTVYTQARPASPSRFPSHAAPALSPPAGITNPVLTAKRGFPSPLQTDMGYVLLPVCMCLCVCVCSCQPVCVISL